MMDANPARTIGGSGNFGALAAFLGSEKAGY